MCSILVECDRRFAQQWVFGDFCNGKPEPAAGVGVGQRASGAVLQHGLHLRVVPDLDEAAVEVLLQRGVSGPDGVGRRRREGFLAAVAEALGRQVRRAPGCGLGWRWRLRRCA